MTATVDRRTFIAGTAALLALRRAHAQGAPAERLLRAAEAEVTLEGAMLRAPIFNDHAAGPLIEMERGQPFALKVENALDFPFHFRTQGLRGRAVEGADTPIVPGQTRNLTILPPDAGTFVYRATDVDAARTVLLAGPLFVAAEMPAIADREVVMALNALVLPGADPAQPALRQPTVNGMAQLSLAASGGERLHLRVVNLAQDSLAGLKFPSEARIVALDGQPCDPFPLHDGALVLSPLARADVLLDVPREAEGGLAVADLFDPQHVLLSLSSAGDTVPERPFAKQFPVNPRLPREIPYAKAVRATWNPEQVPADVLLRVESGGSVVVTFENNATPHALLLDGQTARLLDAMDDGWKPWWHDTLLVQPNEKVRLAFIPNVAGRFAIDMIPLEGDTAPRRTWIEVS